MVRVPQSYILCVVFCDPLFVLGFVLLNIVFSVWFCCDLLFVVRFVLLNLKFSV